MTAMLKAGVPLSKVDLFQDLLEEHGYALTSSTNLRQRIPFIHQEELSRIKQEILNQPLSIIFDGITHVCVPHKRLGAETVCGTSETFS